MKRRTAKDLPGDRASRRAFREILDKWREALRSSGQDPFGSEPSESISKKLLDAVLIGDNAEAAALVHSALEDFAQELAYVTRRFLKTKAWEGTARVVVGGGFRASRLGELAIARADIILKAEDLKIEMVPIRFHPDDAGLIGALHLAPSWIFEGYDNILAVDIGGRISVAEWSRRGTKKRQIFRKPPYGNLNFGDTPTTSPAGTALSSDWSKCSRA